MDPYAYLRQLLVQFPYADNVDQGVMQSVEKPSLRRRRVLIILRLKLAIVPVGDSQLRADLTGRFSRHRSFVFAWLQRARTTQLGSSTG